MIEKVNLKAAANDGALFDYIPIGTLNDHMLNVLQAEDRTLDFHVHDASDELLYCIEGAFDIEFDDGLTHFVQATSSSSPGHPPPSCLHGTCQMSFDRGLWHAQQQQHRRHLCVTVRVAPAAPHIL